MSLASLEVAIAEDSVLLREGLTGILRSSGLDVVAAYDNADDLLMRVRKPAPRYRDVDIRCHRPHRRGHARGAAHSEAPSPRARTRALAVCRAGTGDAAARGVGRRGRLPAEGSHQRRRRVCGCRTTGCPRRLGDRSDDRLHPAPAPARRRSAGPSDARESARCSS